jgi:hypothetical protein
LITQQYTRLRAGIEYASPDFISNDFDYNRYWVSLYRRQRVFGLGYSALNAFVGGSDGQLPPQRWYVVDFGNGVFYRSEGFNTFRRHNFVGDHAASVYIEHDFGDLLFAQSGVPGLKSLPFTLFAHGGAAWTELRQGGEANSEAREKVAPTAYGELGFGIGNLTPFLSPFNFAAGFSWQLSDYETTDFQFTVGIKLR